MDAELRRRIAECQQDHEVEIGRPFDHFHCPILHVDEAVEMCKGHVVPKKFKTSNAWVPQRADMDNFYGTVVESMFVGIVQDRGKDAFHVWLDPKLRRRHRPRIESGGKAVDHYFSLPPSPVEGHTPVQLTTDSGKAICNLTVKMSADELKSLDGSKIQLVVERDYRAPVIASLIKAAHLTLFKMLGYRYVYSASGLYLANILATFFCDHSRSRDVTEEAVESYFRPFSGMVSPMITADPTALQGTVIDNRILGCMASRGGMFALGVIVRAGENDAFCVFVPTDDGIASGTYPGFVKEPPKSIATKLIQFFPTDGEKESHWGSDKSEPVRIPLPDHFETPEYAPPAKPGRRLKVD